MNRRNTMVAVLGVVLLVALTWVLLYQPKNAEIEEFRAQTATTEAQTAELVLRIDALRIVRETAPEIEAELVAATAIIPREPALPSALRQLQLAADESGVTLKSLAPARPEPVTIEGGAEGLARLNLSVDIEAEYFQIVDFLRRLEDPAISPRGLVWTGALVGSEYDDYPMLTVSLVGDLFAVMPALTPVEEGAPEAPAEGEVAEAPAEGENAEAPAADADAGEEADPADTVEVE